MTRKLTIAVALLTVALMCGAALAQETAPPPPPPGATPPGPAGGFRAMGQRAPQVCVAQVLQIPVPEPREMQRIQTMLTLQPEQVTKLRALIDASMQKRRTAAESFNKAAGLLRGSFGDPAVTADKLKASIEALMKSEEDVTRVNMAFWLDFRAMLTPEQVQKLPALLEPRSRSTLRAPRRDGAAVPLEGIPDEPPPPGAPGAEPPPP